VFFFIVGIVAAVFFAMVVEPFYIMKLTQLYDYYRDGRRSTIQAGAEEASGTSHTRGVVLGACLVTALVLDIWFEAYSRRRDRLR
jgi:hypothetical protein